MIRVFKSGEVARADILYRGESGSTQAVEDAVADIHRKVDDLAMTGRFACRLRDEKTDRAVNLAEELYRYSREKYMEMEE